MYNFDLFSTQPTRFPFDLTRDVAIFMNGIGTEL